MPRLSHSIQVWLRLFDAFSKRVINWTVLQYTTSVLVSSTTYMCLSLSLSLSLSLPLISLSLSFTHTNTPWLKS